MTAEAATPAAQQLPAGNEANRRRAENLEAAFAAGSAF